MTFGRWHALAEAATGAPAGPGIFQIRRANGLTTYPRGRSAMLYYGCADNLRAAIADYAAAHPDADWWCRHSIEMSQHEADNLTETFESLVDQFERRFGRPPMAPS